MPIRDGADQPSSLNRFQDKRTQIENLYKANFGPEVSEHAIWRGFEKGTGVSLQAFYASLFMTDLLKQLLCVPGDTSMKYLIVALNSFPGTGANLEAGTPDTSRAPWLNFANNMIKVNMYLISIFLRF